MEISVKRKTRILIIKVLKVGIIVKIYNIVNMIRITFYNLILFSVYHVGFYVHSVCKKHLSKLKRVKIFVPIGVI
jgi:hypothetical protein